MSRSVVVTGGSGYIGTRFIARLIERGHSVRALVRASSASRIPNGCEVVVSDVLSRESIAMTLTPNTTLVQLVGTPHPSPAKAALFRSVDLVSALASIAAARDVGVEHFVYLSVAHPAPVMHAYVATRVEAEAALRATGLPATVLRPWYVLGPGHQWPHALRPLYALAELVPSLRKGALRLGLVTVNEMVNALVWAVENSPARAAGGEREDNQCRVIEVPELRWRAPTGDAQCCIGVA